MVDFKKMLERGKQAKARKCPVCDAAPNMNCIATGVPGEFTPHDKKLQFNKGEEVVIMHPERYSDYKPKASTFKKKTDLEF